MPSFFVSPSEQECSVDRSSNRMNSVNRVAWVWDGFCCSSLLDGVVEKLGYIAMDYDFVPWFLNVPRRTRDS